MCACVGARAYACVCAGVCRRACACVRVGACGTVNITGTNRRIDCKAIKCQKIKLAPVAAILTGLNVSSHKMIKIEFYCAYFLSIQFEMLSTLTK